MEQYLKNIPRHITEPFRYNPTATFMQFMKDYTGNDQLLPEYNLQFGITDEYIAVVDVNHYRPDMECFIPLVEQFHKLS